MEPGEVERIEQRRKRIFSWRRVDEAREMWHHPDNRGAQGERGEKENTILSNTVAKSNWINTEPCS